MLTKLAFLTDHKKEIFKHFGTGMAAILNRFAVSDPGVKGPRGVH